MHLNNNKKKHTIEGERKIKNKDLAFRNTHSQFTEVLLFSKLYSSLRNNGTPETQTWATVLVAPSRDIYFNYSALNYNCNEHGLPICWRKVVGNDNH